MSLLSLNITVSDLSGTTEWSAGPDQIGFLLGFFLQPKETHSWKPHVYLSMISVRLRLRCVCTFGTESSSSLLGDDSGRTTNRHQHVVTSLTWKKTLRLHLNQVSSDTLHKNFIFTLIFTAAVWFLDSPTQDQVFLHQWQSPDVSPLVLWICWHRLWSDPDIKPQ